jgi:hypothetical protein
VDINSGHKEEQTYSISDIRRDSDIFAPFMKTQFLAFFLLLSFFGVQALAVGVPTGEKDLKPDWLVRNTGDFVSYRDASGSPEVVYLKLNAREISGQLLKIQGIRSFNLFINNQLAGSGKYFLLNVDSLARAFSANNLLVAIHLANGRFGNLVTALVPPAKPSDLTDGLVKREGSFFRDFGILGIVLLMGMVVLIVRLNPKLASDYFSIGGVFSTREIGDSQVYTRIGSSTNILFYAYCSMLLAYYLMIAFHFTGDEFPLANSFQGNYFWSVVLQWMKLSAYLLIFFFLKIILVFGISYLFGIPHIAGIHFFNWVRLLIIIFGLLTMILFVYFIWHGQSTDVHSAMLKLLGWIMGGWIILIFLKLSGNASTSLFHLFSYICATELIPFLFIIKVLYK